MLAYKREIWGIQQDDSGNFTHWWHPSRGYWNNAPAAFKKIAATHGSKPQSSLAETSGGAMFIGLKEDGRFAVCFNTGGDSWSRFRNDWHGVGPAIVEVTACMQGDGLAYSVDGLRSRITTMTENEYGRLEQRAARLTSEHFAGTSCHQNLTTKEKNRYTLARYTVSNR